MYFIIVIHIKSHSLNPQIKADNFIEIYPIKTGRNYSLGQWARIQLSDR